MTTTKGKQSAALTVEELTTRIERLEEQVRFLFGLPPTAFPRGFYEKSLATVLDQIGEREAGSGKGKRRK